MSAKMAANGIRTNARTNQTYSGIEVTAILKRKTTLTRTGLFDADLFTATLSVSTQTRFDVNQLKALLFFFFSFDTRGRSVCVFA